MVKPLLPEAEFVELFETQGATAVSRHTGQNIRSVFERRNNIERKIGRAIVPPKSNFGERKVTHYPYRVELNIPNGHVLIGSDAHLWPGEPTTAWKAFVAFAKKMVPRAIIMNGDVFDGASVSRHPPIGWTRLPTVVEEIETCQERMGEIERVKTRQCRLILTRGNHDVRFDSRLAAVAPEYAKVHGASLEDHLSAWQFCLSAWINNSVVVKHRWRGGVHGVHTNTVNSGKTIITGHDHALRVSPFSDYSGTRWGVSCGMLAEPYGDQFVEYSEDNPRSHRSGFVVLTFVDGRLLWPEIVHVVEPGVIEFRGELMNV